MTKYSFSLLSQGLLIGALMLAGCCCHDDDNDTDPVPVNSHNGHEYVDLGLPSGLKWATCNVGASKPEEYGDYFAWGDIATYYESGYAQEDPQAHWKNGKENGYGWSTYKWSDGSGDLTKYCRESQNGYNGFTDTDTILVAEDDAASYNWGGSWRMPTCADWEELKDNCKWDWFGKNNSEFGGIAGYKVTSQKEGFEDRFIFLPASGLINYTQLLDVGLSGSYWSSTLQVGVSYIAYMHVISSGTSRKLGSYRYIGMSVRPVFP